MANSKLTREEEKVLIENVYNLRQLDPEPSLLQIIKLTADALYGERAPAYLTKNSAAGIIEGVKRLCKVPAPAPAPAPAPIKEIIVNDNNELNNLRKYIDKVNNRVEEVNNRLNDLWVFFNKKKPRIGIVGVMSPQFHDLEREFKDSVNLVFIDREQAQMSLPQKLHLVICTKFIQHKMSAQLENQYGSNNVIVLQSGGTSSVKAAINDYLNKE